MNLKRVAKRIIRAAQRDEYAITFSQSGEDRILLFLFGFLEIEKPSYLDIGANDPTNLSNTFLLYTQGSTGVCVEPNPLLCGRFRERRPRDKCLNIGIAAGSSQKLDLYVFENTTMSTFSKEACREQQDAGEVLREVVSVEVMGINDVIAQNFASCPQLVSLDTEGLDYPILQSLDFSRYRPEVFCIETITNIEEQKAGEIFELMKANEYIVYADTYVNTIFVDERRWRSCLERRVKEKMAK